MYLINRPTRKVPYASWRAPATAATNTSNTTMRAGSGAAAPDGGAPSNSAANAASTAAAGAHGAEIRRGAPPSSGASTPRIAAPTIPARTPAET